MKSTFLVFECVGIYFYTACPLNVLRASFDNSIPENLMDESPGISGSFLKVSIVIVSFHDFFELFSYRSSKVGSTAIVDHAKADIGREVRKASDLERCAYLVKKDCRKSFSSPFENQPRILV